MWYSFQSFSWLQCHILDTVIISKMAYYTADAKYKSIYSYDETNNNLYNQINISSENVNIDEIVISVG